MEATNEIGKNPAGEQSSAKGATLSGGLERFCIEDAKEEIAELFFQCARYERPSFDWKNALDTFCRCVIAEERESCATMVDHILKEGGGTYGDAMRKRSNAKLTSGAHTAPETE